MTDNNEHEMTCRECGEPFDKRSLDEVLFHEHDGLLQSVDTDMAYQSPYDEKIESVAVVLDEFPPMQILQAIQKLANDPDSLIESGDVLTIASNLSTDEEMQDRIGLSEADEYTRD